MVGTGSVTPRDPAKPAAYFHTYVARRHEELLAYRKSDNPKLYYAVAPICLRIGVALYSAGEDVSECRHWFSEAATYQRRFLSEGRQFKLGGIGAIDNYLELYSAAFLAGKSDELIAVLKQCSYSEPAHAAEVRLLAQFCDLLEGHPVTTDDAQVAVLESLWKPWACLPTLFSAVSTRDKAKAAPVLEDYLANVWGPPVEKWAKKALKAPIPEYHGKWFIFSGAACKVLGTVPDLSVKAKVYVPTDLVST